MKCLQVSKYSKFNSGDEVVYMTSASCPGKCRKTVISVDAAVQRFKDEDYQIDYYRIAKDRINRYRSELTTHLNNVHNEGFTEKEWGRILDSWISVFVHVVIDRVDRVSLVNEIDHNVFVRKTVDLKSPAYTVKHFRKMAAGDEYNQYFYQLLLHCVEDSGEKSTSKISREHHAARCNPINIYTKKVIRVLIGAWASVFRSVVVFDGYFSIKDMLSLMIRTLGKIILVPSRFVFDGTYETYNWSGVNIDWDQREGFSFDEHDKYDTAANKIFSVSFPVSFLEAYIKLRFQLNHFYNISATGSATGFHSSDTYKILSALMLKNNKRTFGIQHGGDYGFYPYRLNEELEIASVDKWYSNGTLAGGVAMPCPKIRRKNRTMWDEKGRILLVSTNIRRYQTWAPNGWLPEQYDMMLDAQFKFYGNLNDKERALFQVRAYPQDYGWGYKSRWIEAFGDGVQFDEYKNFYESLQHTRVVVVDNFNTTWIESIVHDLPLIMFANVDGIILNDKARRFFTEMKEAGILHEDSKSAAGFLNTNIGSILEWWMSKKTRKVIGELKDAFMSESPLFIQRWENELLGYRY